MAEQYVWDGRMAAKVPVSDTTHQMFWRRMIRWLVDGVPDQVNVTTTADRVEPGEPIKVAAEVLDQAYAEVNDATVTAHITSPSGRTTDVPIDWTSTNVASLPEAISYSGRGVTVVEERELWDMPALFMLLIGLVSAEWGYRRVRGLA